jgi:hypothetical protein
MGAATDAALLARAVRNPGRLCLGPTTKTGSFPYGGKSLGFSRENEVDFQVEYYKSLDPSSGALLEVSRRRVEIPVFSFLAEGMPWDEDLVAATFAKSTSGLGSPVETRAEGSVMPGVVQAWNPVLFKPFDDNLPCIYLRRPVSLLSMRRAVQLAMARKAGLPIFLYPLVAEGYQSTPYWQFGRFSNILL